jgi:bacterioferritin B
MTTTSENSQYLRLLGEQVGHELAAHLQYVAIAVWFDSHDLPQLAAHFYRQALEERNHGMMIVQYHLDRGLPVQIPGTPAVRNDFADVIEPLQLALDQEQQVTRQIEAIFRAAREEGDALGEQFLMWFLEEQVEEVARHRRQARRRQPVRPGELRRARDDRRRGRVRRRPEGRRRISLTVSVECWIFAPFPAREGQIPSTQRSGVERA